MRHHMSCARSVAKSLRVEMRQTVWKITKSSAREDSAWQQSMTVWSHVTSVAKSSASKLDSKLWLQIAIVLIALIAIVHVSRASNLSRHMKVHQKPLIKCQKCETSFKTKYGLNVHKCPNNIKISSSGKVIWFNHGHSLAYQLYLLEIIMEDASTKEKLGQVTKIPILSQATDKNA